MKKRRQLKNIGSAQKTRQKAMSDRQEVLKKEFWIDTLYMVTRVSQMFKLGNQCWPQVFLVKYTHRIRGNQKYLIFLISSIGPSPSKF